VRVELIGIGSRSIVKSILAVESLTIQRSLTILEDRYRELRKIGERWSESWAAERADLLQQLTAQAVSLQEVQAAQDEQAAKMKGLEAELSRLKSERDAFAEGKCEAEAIAAGLQNEIAAQAASLQELLAARDLQTAQLMGLETDLNMLKHQRENLLTGLQRLRQAARPVLG
jgi:chromosome segregation ATPase